MPLLQTPMRWPFRWLLGGSSIPRAVDVRSQIVPTVDIGQHNPSVEVFREDFTMAAGANVVFLPGLSRAASLNPASFPTPTSRGARRWLSLSCMSDTALGAGDNYELSTSHGTLKHELAFIAGSSTWPADTPVPLIRAAGAAITVASQARPYPTSVYVPDPLLLFLRLLSQVGGEVLTISGTFLESDSREQALPDMYA